MTSDHDHTGIVRQMLAKGHAQDVHAAWQPTRAAHRQPLRKKEDALHMKHIARLQELESSTGEKSLQPCCTMLLYGKLSYE